MNHPTRTNGDRFLRAWAVPGGAVADLLLPHRAVECDLSHGMLFPSLGEQGGYGAVRRS
jgi:hypothetical protein